MNQFQPDRPCAKCGGVTKDVEFRLPGSGLASESLRVRCRTCGYIETVAPLDDERATRVTVGNV